MSNQGPLIREVGSARAQRRAEQAREQLLSIRESRDAAAKAVLPRLNAPIGRPRGRAAEQTAAFRQAFVEGTRNSDINADRTRQALANQAGGKNALDSLTKNALRPMDPQAVSVDRTLVAMSQANRTRSAAEWNSIAAALETESVRTAEQTTALSQSTKAAVTVVGVADLQSAETNTRSHITKEADNLRKNEAAKVKISKFLARFRAQEPIADGTGRTASQAELANLELMVEFNDVVETVMAGAKGNPAQMKLVKRAVVLEAVAREASTTAELQKDAEYHDTAQALHLQANAATDAVVTVETVQQVAAIEQVRTQEMGIEQVRTLPPLAAPIQARR